MVQCVSWITLCQENLRILKKNTRRQSEAGESYWCGPEICYSKGNCENSKDLPPFFFFFFLTSFISITVLSCCMVSMCITQACHIVVCLLLATSLQRKEVLPLPSSIVVEIWGIQPAEYRDTPNSRVCAKVRIGNGTFAVAKYYACV